MKDIRFKPKLAISIIICILLNFGGKAFAAHFNLPVWLDAVGTVLAAYTTGPFGGLVVGLTVNLIYSLWDTVSLYYGLVSMLIGIIVGLFSRKGYFKSLFNTLTVGAIVTLTSVVISFPLNMLLYGGATGNLWGDQVVEFLSQMGWNYYLCCLIGEFYVDFLDKLLAMLLLYLIIKIKQKTLSAKSVEAVAMLCIMVSAMLLPRQVLAEEADHDYNVYTQTEYEKINGQSGGSTTDIACTRDGCLWIGTYNGLYKYDGVNFIPMTGISHVKNVNNLYVDEEGRLLVGTNDSGLVIAIGDTEVNVLSKTDGMPSNSIRTIVRDSNGNYYVGTTDSMAVLRFDGGLQISGIIDDINYSKSIAADREGHVATVTDSGTLYLIKNGQIIGQFSCTNNKEIFTACTFSSNGELFAGTSDGNVLVYSIGKGELVRKATVNCPGISSINSFSELDEVMFLCSDSGVGYVDDTDYSYTPINTGNFNSSIDSVLVDYQGNIWFTSSRQGLLKLSKSAFDELFTQTGLSPVVVNSTQGVGSLLYLGTDAGLEIIDLDTLSPVENELTQQFAGIRIRSIIEDNSGNLWISTTGSGLFRISRDEIKQFMPEDGVLGDRFRMVLDAVDGTIIAAGDSGVSFIDGDTVTGTVGQQQGMTNTKILCVQQKSDGAIYAGSDGDGIYVIEDGTVTGKISTAEGLPSDVILRIVPDTVKDCFFLVLSNGLCYLDEAGNISYLDKFPYSNNYDLIVDDGACWVLGSAGIYVVDRQELIDNTEGMIYDLLNEKKGLSATLTANAWNYVDDDGCVYLSEGSGASKINMHTYDQLTKSYRMSLNNIVVDGATYDISRNDVITIPSAASKVEITPQVLNYSMNDPYLCYYLEGFEEEETSVNVSAISTITYTNLPAGTYTFHMTLLNDRQTEVLESGSYTFVKENEMYETWWFRVYMIFVLALAIMYVTWFMTRMSLQKSLENQKLKLEMTEKQLQMGNEMVFSIAQAVDAKDSNTSQHSTRVAEYSVLIGQRLGYSEEELENLKKTAQLHDIGKIGIPDAILNKPGKLTDEEYAIMKTHVDKGGEILSGFTVIENVAEGALYHHERYDGRGYSHGLGGEDIPLNARIIGIADAFDAMTANRVYRKQLDFDFVIEELKRGRGTQFDPKLTDIMLSLIDDGTIDVASLYENMGVQQPDTDGEGR